MVKKLFCRLTVFILLMNGGIAWGQVNLVENGDFESGSTGWNEWSSPGGWTTGTFIHDYADGCDIWIQTPYPYEGANTHSQRALVANIHGGLYQVIDVLPGKTYTVSGVWAGGVGGIVPAPPAEPIPQAWFEITIYDGAATVDQIDAAPGPNDIIITKREHVGNTPYSFDWEQFSQQFSAKSSQVTLAIKTGRYVGPDYPDYIAAYHDQIAIEPLHSMPIPTMTEWGMIIFTLLLTGSAIWYMRKQSHSGQMT